VITYTKCGGLFNNHFTANLIENFPVKRFENRLMFDRIMAISLVGYAVFGRRKHTSMHSGLICIGSRSEVSIISYAAICRVERNNAVGLQ